MSEKNNKNRKTFHLETFVPFRLNVASGAISFHIQEQCLQPENITQAEWRILTTLGAEGPSAQSRFVKRSPMDKITVTRTVKSLINAGLVESRESELDRRSRLLTLTPKGLSLYRSLAAKTLQLESELLEEAGISDPEEFIERLHRLELAVSTLRRKHRVGKGG
jgi:DNA-binding MarR family transcriptional regulator